MKVLLFASGISTRWKGSYPKHLAMVEGKHVIARTLDQLDDRSLSHIVITHVPEIRNVVWGSVFFSPPSSHWPNTFLDSECLWKDRVIALHADVVWDDKALDIILESYGLGFYGTRKGPWENFAIAFDPEHYERMKLAAQKALDACGESERCGTWEVYRSLVGIPIGSTRRFESKVWHEVKKSRRDDYTCDFDTLEKYATFLKENPWAR